MGNSPYNMSGQQYNQPQQNNTQYNQPQQNPQYGQPTYNENNSQPTYTQPQSNDLQPSYDSRILWENFMISFRLWKVFKSGFVLPRACISST